MLVGPIGGCIVRFIPDWRGTLLPPSPLPEGAAMPRALRAGLPDWGTRHMDKTVIGLLGAIGALAAGATSPAAAAPVAIEAAMHAATYADLLKPIPNASALLRASDAALGESEPELILAQYHDHHHHRTYRRRRPPVRRNNHHHHSMMILPGAPQPV